MGKLLLGDSDEFRKATNPNEFTRKLLMADKQRKAVDHIAASAVEQFALKLNEERRKDTEKFLQEVRDAYNGVSNAGSAAYNEREQVVIGLLLDKLFSLGYREAMQFCKSVIWKTL